MKARNLLISLALVGTSVAAQQATPAPRDTPPTNAPDAAPGTLPPPASILPPPAPAMPLPRLTARQEEQVRSWLAQGSA